MLANCRLVKISYKISYVAFYAVAKMASECVAKRGFGGYTKHFWATTVPRKSYNKLTWVNRWYTPTDLRPTIPAQAHKFVGSSRPPCSVPPCWVLRPEAPPKRLSRIAEGERLTPSSQATRSEEWSTLRQMLPSSGHPIKNKPEKWGTSGELALPTISQTRPQNYPKINSTMTK